MAYTQKEEAEAKAMTQRDYNYLTERINNLYDKMYQNKEEASKKFRLLIRILVDKKIVGVELAKSIEETFSEKTDEDLIGWLIKELELE